MKKTYIYTLLEPNTGIPRYVGKTNNLKQRFQNHINPARNTGTYKFNWINKLRKEGEKPTMKVLEKVNIECWKVREKYWIRCFLKKGYKLVNTTTGGDGLTFGNQTSFKKGQKSWNKGLGNVKSCISCNTEYLCNPTYNKKTCSKKCSRVYKKNIGKRTGFKLGSTPWNKGKTYKGKKAKSIIQMDLEGNILTKYRSYKEAAIALNKPSPENIRRCCVGLSKTAYNYKWKYEAKNN